MAAEDEARAKIQRLLVTGDNRLKQGVAPEKVRESYEQALAVAREAGLEDSVAAAGRAQARRPRPASAIDRMPQRRPQSAEPPRSSRPRSARSERQRSAARCRARGVVELERATHPAAILGSVESMRHPPRATTSGSAPARVTTGMQPARIASATLMPNPS